MLIFAVILSCLMLTVMITDITRYTIPNWLVGLMLLLYPALVLLSPVKIDWPVALGVGVATFAAGFVLFTLKAVGGGDVKLLAAVALFVGAPAYLDYIVGVALLGGVFTILLVLLRPFTAFLFSKLKKPPAIPAVLTSGEPVPYGVAIAIAFLYLIWNSKIPGLVL